VSLDRWGRSPGFSSNAFSRFFYRQWFRVEWEGLEHVPPEGGALLVANHAGIIPVDGAMVQYGVETELGRPVYALAHDGFWRYPFIGKLMSRWGAVVGHPDNAQRLLRDEKQLVVVLPEGAKGPVKPRAERYRLQRFGRGGFVETAMRAGVPIVPMAILGTEDSTPLLTTVQLLGQEAPITWNALVLGPLLGSVGHLPVKIRIRVLEPVHFDEPPDLPSYPRSLVMDHAEEIRARMQDALDDLLRARTSWWS
jgi:1-acyl-sn-glycerol-3-phosphate acyltransferase